MKRLHDALCSVVQRLPMPELARIIERDPRSARRWVQVLVGEKRLADLSVVAVLHLARYETMAALVLTRKNEDRVAFARFRSILSAR